MPMILGAKIRVFLISGKSLCLFYPLIAIFIKSVDSWTLFVFMKKLVFDYDKLVFFMIVFDFEE